MAVHGILDTSTLGNLHSWTWGTIILSLISPLVATYLITSLSSSAIARRFTDPRRPPIAPYYLPYIGHAIEMSIRPFELFERNRQRFGRDSLWKLTLPGFESFQTSTADQVGKVFRAQGMESAEILARSYQHSFGMPERAAALYENDDSGYGPKVDASSAVKAEERIILMQHDFVARNLTGDSLATAVRHYQHHLQKSLAELADSLGDEWMEISDLTTFMRHHVTTAAVTSMFGPHLIRLNPDLVEDIWSFVPVTIKLLLQIPRWLLPSAYSVRDKLLDGIVRYYDHAKEHYRGKGSDEQWEEFYGSSFTRKKHLELWPRFEAMDARARAAEDLSFLWAMNANSVESIIWSFLEILRDPDLLTRIRAEATESLQSEESNTIPTTMFNPEHLCSRPVSQAVYAEVLRLRVNILLMRKAKSDIMFDGWLIKKGERVCATSATRARDERTWNTGTAEDPHPVDEFWADRFLIYPNDPSSGPLKNPPSAKSTDRSPDSTWTDGPRFSMTGLTNTWIPYSGGPRHCPGRHFAKQEIIIATAMVATMFDVELMTPKGWAPQPDMGLFGTGTLLIKGKVPCRIKRRKF